MNSYSLGHRLTSYSHHFCTYSLPFCINRKKEDDEGANFIGKYSNPHAGQAPFGGWSNRGLQRFKKYKSLIKVGRSKAKVDDLEDKLLGMVRQANGKPADVAAEPVKKKAKSGIEREDIEEILFDDEDDGIVDAVLSEEEEDEEEEGDDDEVNNNTE